MTSIRMQLAGLDAVRRTLSDVDQQQIPFAAKNALNAIGLKAQKVERARMAAVFTLRRRDFIEKQGVKIMQFATKDRLSLTIGVDSKADFLDKFEAGGTKRARKSAGLLAVPINARRNKADIVTAGQRPRALLDRLGERTGAGSAFIVKRAQGALGPGIYLRTGRGGHGDPRLMFELRPSARIQPVLQFARTVTLTAREEWPHAFALALRDALKTAR